MQTVSHISVDDILAASGQVEALRLAASGQFDDKIAEVKALNEELARRQGIVYTLDAAAKVKADADQYRLGAQAQADQIAKDAADIKAQADSLLQAARDRVEAAAATVALMTAKVSQMDSDINARNAALDLRAQEWATRESYLAVGQSALDDAKAALEADRAALAKDKATLNARLEALKM